MKVQNTIRLSLLTVLAAVIAIASVYAMKAKHHAKKSGITIYYLMAGKSASDALHAENYQTSPPDGVTCNNVAEVPCYYIFNEGGPYDTFQDLLDTKSTTTVVTDADARRSE